MLKRLMLATVLCLCLIPALALGEGLTISEACNNNDSLWAMDFVDYVELYNAGDSEVELSDYALSRDEEDLLDCILPHGKLAPKAYAVLYCDGSDLSFNLPKLGCMLYLTDKRSGEPIAEAEIPSMEDAFWTYDMGIVDYPSPGQPNTPEGFEAYRAGLAQTLVINEAVSSNSSVLEVEGESYDLIELANVGAEELLLSDYFISDKKKELKMTRLPDKTLAPGEYAVIYASGLEQTGHAAFKVSADGEGLYVTRKDGVCVDAVYVPSLETDTSYGRMGDALVYFEEPSIGKPNQEGSPEVASTPEPSQPTGLYRKPFELTFKGEGTIYYTLDGRDPREKGIEWDGAPLEIAQNTIVRVCAASEGAMTSPVGAYHYLFDCEKYELPILSISSAPNGILGSRGVWEQYKRSTMEAEAHAALIENGETRFSLFCGVRLHGEGSRALNKKSMQLRFRGRYGQSSLNVPIFDGIDFSEYDALVLRCGSEDYNRAFLRDEFLTSLMAETMPEVLYQAHKPVNVFVDGQYFGIYYIREKLNDTFVSYHLGGAPEKADMVKGWRIPEHGSAEDFLALLKDCRKKDLSDDAAFNGVAERISLEGFMDYYIARAYTGDRDYPNIRHVRAEGGKWHIVNYDLDWGFGTDPARFGSFIGTVKDTNAQNTVIINALVRNRGFRDAMLARVAWHMRNTFEPSRVIAHLDAMADTLRHDMVYDRERWRLTMDKWEEHLEFLREFARNRVPVMLESAKTAFRMTDEEVDKYFGDLWTAR